MKVVLLPGMDGTGKLFEPLLPFLTDFSVEVIPLPESGPQDYPALVFAVRPQLPQDEFVLIAESFSGAIAALIAQECPANLRAIIFVASFLKPPKKFILNIVKFLSLPVLMNLPGASLGIRWLMLGYRANGGEVVKLRSVLQTLNGKLLKRRVRSMLNLPIQTGVQSATPVLYLQAAQDRLVSSNQATYFSKYFNDLEVITVNGPHFVLHSKPRESAKIIKQWLAK